MNFSACIPYPIRTISFPLWVRGVGYRYLSFSLFPINFVLLHLKVNSLFLLKSRFVGGYDGANKKLPFNSDEESSLVAGDRLTFFIFRWLKIKQLIQSHFDMLSVLLSDNSFSQNIKIPNSWPTPFQKVISLFWLYPPIHIRYHFKACI